MLPNAVGDAALTSILQVLAAGVGNASYQRTVESSFMSFFAFAEKQAARDEATEEATSERQNRIMQQAILPYGERLLLVHRTAIGEGNRVSSLSYLTPWQVTEAIVGTRSGVTAHHIRLGRDHVVIEIDETYNKQIIYIACTRAEGGDATNMDSGSYNWDQEVERVDVSESEESRQTLFHSEFLAMATRLCDALVHETPLHPTRKTVLIGHAVGGAVSVIMALLLSQRGFDVANVITFGAPKAMQGTLERYVAAINPVRVVLAGDPLVELPVTGSEGDPFKHIGEILLLSPRQGRERGGDDAGRDDPRREERGPERREGGSASGEGDRADTVVSELAEVMSAEDLAAVMSDDLVGVSQPPTTVSSSSGEEKEEGVAEGEGEREELEEEEEEEEEADLRSLCRIAEERYRQHFLVEDYIRHLADPSVELTYAEGDEVWDDGEYASSVRRGAAEPRVSPEERRQRDLRGAL